MVANKNKSPESVVEAKPPKVFRKENILRFKRYAGRRDLLSVLLDAEQEYTLEQVDTLMDNTVKKQKCPDFSIGQHKKTHSVSQKFPYFHLIYALGAPAHRLTNGWMHSKSMPGCLKINLSITWI